MPMCKNSLGSCSPFSLGRRSIVGPERLRHSMGGHSDLNLLSNIVSQGLEMPRSLLGMLAERLQFSSPQALTCTHAPYNPTTSATSGVFNTILSLALQASSKRNTQMKTRMPQPLKDHSPIPMVQMNATPHSCTLLRYPIPR